MLSLQGGNAIWFSSHAPQTPGGSKEGPYTSETQVAAPIAAALPGVVLWPEQINVNSGTSYEAIRLISAFSSIPSKKENQKQYRFAGQLTL